MKKITFLLLAFLSFCFTQAQVQVGAGTTSQTSLPIYSCYGYSYTQQIYLASEILSNGSITSLKFYYTGGGPAANSTGWTVYLGHSAKTSFASTTDWEASANLTQVYTGTVAFPTAPGWMTITLDAPFAYNGTDNLIVAVDENIAGYTCSVGFNGFASGSTRGIYYISDSTNPDPTAPPTAYSTTATLSNIVFGGINPLTAPNCTQVSSPADAALNVASSVVSWAGATGSPSGYNITVGTSAGGSNVLNNVNIGNVTSYNIPGLEAGTTYFVTITPYNDNGSATGCATTSFTTCDENTTLTENFDTAATGSTAALPTCWDRTGTTGSSYVTTGSVAPASPSNRWYMYAYNGAVCYAHTPILSNLAANSHRLRFKAYATSANKTVDVGYLATAGDVSTFTLLQSVNLGTGTTAASILEYVVIPGALPTGVNKLVFRNNSVSGSFASTTVYFDDVIWEEQPSTAPTCATVVATPNATCGNFATSITWDAVSGINGYKLSIGTTAGGTEILNNQVTTATSYAHSGNPGVTYYVRVVPFNGVGDATGCTEVLYSTNATGCYCTSAPTSVDGVGITNVKIVNTDFPNTISAAPYYNDLTATVVDVQQGVNTNLQISFSTSTYDYNTRVWIDFNDNFTFETSELVYSGLSSSVSPNILDASFLMSATAALGQHRMRIVATDAIQTPANPCYSGGYGMTLDFKVNMTPAPACLPPTVLVASAITTTGATLSWTASASTPSNGYSYYFSTSNTAPDATTVASGTTAAGVFNASISGLTDNTVYYFWAKSNCSSSTSSIWSISGTFRTPCVAFAIPFTETFDSDSTTEACWTVNNFNADADAWDTNYTSNPFAGNQSAILYTDYNAGANNDWLITPKLTLTGNQRIRFQSRVQSSFEPNDFELLLSTTGNAPADFTNTLIANTSYSNITYNELVTSLAAYSGNVYIAFHVPNGGLDGWRLYIDSVVVEDIPTSAPACVSITSPTNAAVNVMSGTITWNTSLDATSYKISVGTTPTGTEVLNLFSVGNVTTYNLATEPGTTYYVTVYPVNQYGTSTGCTTISFTTCDSLNAPVLETFDTFLPGCWSNRFGGDLTTGPAATGSSEWGADGFANNGFTGAIRNNIYYTGANDWVISPVVSIPATGYELKFDAAAVQYGGTGAPTIPWEADDMIQVLVSTNGTSWTALYTFNNTNQPSISGTTTTIDLDAYAAQDVRFAFRAVEGTADGSADIDFSIDNFEVRLTPAVAPGCSTITATTNANCGNFATAITWTAASGANGYKLSIGTTAGGTQVLNASDLGTALTYTHIGTIGTTYYVTVTPYNTVGDATGCTSISYTTNSAGCYCPSAPSSVDGTGITNVQVGTTDFPNTVATSPVYNDHTATAVNMTQGVSNNVQLTFSVLSWGTTSYDYNTVIWVDGNDNYNFEASEIVYTGVSPTTAAPTSLNASFVMPTSVPAGIHRMRIVATDDAQNPANACYSGSYGETADFKVNVIVLKNDTFDDASFVYYPNPVSDVLNISYANEISKVQVMNLLGQEVMVKSINATQSQIDMSNLASGSYLVKVTADNKVKTIKVIKR